MRWTLKDLIEHAGQNSTHIPGKDIWVPARPVNWKFEGLIERIRNAWLVFIGKADVVIWPEGQ